MIVAVSSADVTVGLYVFSFVCLTLAVVVGCWPTIQGWLSLLAGRNVAVSWDEVALRSGPTVEEVKGEFIDWRTIDWDDLRRAGREHAERRIAA